MLKPIRVLTLMSGAWWAVIAHAGMLDIGPDARTALDLTIYNDDLALVNDAYRAKLPTGESTINFIDTSPLIDPASAVLHPLPPALQVTGQYFQAAITPQSLLDDSLGQTVSLIDTNPVTGEQTYERARILSLAGGLILEIDGRYETDLAGRRIVYEQLPDGVLSPTLSIGVQSTANVSSSIVLSYLTTGLSWSADYIAQLNEARNTLQLRAMASLENSSGMPFKDAKIQLVAGSVHRVRTAIPMQRSGVMAMDSERPVQQAPVADLHVYSLPGRVDLGNNSTRQVKLFEARDVPVKQKYKLAGQTHLYYSPNAHAQTAKIDSYIEFTNQHSPEETDFALGVPMPAGVVRVYTEKQADPEKLLFIGEDKIGHTPEHAEVRLNLGHAFDITATRSQQTYKRLPVEKPYRHHSEATVKTEILNAGNETVIVQVEEIFSGEWIVVEGPQPSDRSARTGRWDVKVPAHGTAMLNLLVRVKN